VTRLVKWYSPYEQTEQKQILKEVHRIVAKRNKAFTNFVEYRNFKIIYRRYASLYFSFGVDVNDNELAILESIHLLVETLDRYHESVRELDLVWNFHRLYNFLDELYLAGEVQETSKAVVLARLNLLLDDPENQLKKIA
jgi:AP-2 complex subunit sigma-1